jgi:hypothetical protein
MTTCRPGGARPSGSDTLSSVIRNTYQKSHPMMEFLKRLFSSDFMPHGYCYLWKPEIVWLNAISDGTITLAYYLIPRRKQFRILGGYRLRSGHRVGHAGRTTSDRRSDRHLGPAWLHSVGIAADALGQAGKQWHEHDHGWSTERLQQQR